MAQKFSLRGKVTDVPGKSIEGATVSEKDKKASTFTNPDGTFLLNDSSGNSKTVIGFVGYENIAIAANNQP